MPNKSLSNPFNADHSNLSASDLGKEKPGQWIPIYYIKDISEYFRESNVMLIRAGQAEFFFYKVNIFFYLDSIDFQRQFKQ